MKALLQNILLLSLSVVFAAILAELSLRIMMPPPVVWKYPQESYSYDPEIGHRLEPNQNAFTHDKVVSTNSVGIRDSEYSRQASSEIYRILGLGDSQTFGNGLTLADTWPKQLETLLNQPGNATPVEVLNCGLPGSDTWQHEIILKRMLAQYDPDAIVLAFYVNDVVKRNIPERIENGVDNELSSRISYLLKRSALLLTLRNAWSSVMQWWSPSGGFTRQLALLKGEDSPVLDERWKQVEQSLSVMKKSSDEHGIPFVIMSIPRRDQIDGRLPWDVYHSRLEAISTKYDIPLISMLDPLQRSFKIHGAELFIPWDGHNSRIANHTISRELAGTILATMQRSDVE